MNVNKLCTQCNQIVYPLEQFKCLDQVWHRRCFRCQTCGMALNMGNYRGYEKKPYCSAHYPQPKRFTFVADTPELQRVAQNTRVMSNINYNQEARRLWATRASTIDDRVLAHQTRLSKQYSEANYHQRPHMAGSTDGRTGATKQRSASVTVTPAWSSLSSHPASLGQRSSVSQLYTTSTTGTDNHSKESNGHHLENGALRSHSSSASPGARFGKASDQSQESRVAEGDEQLSNRLDRAAVVRQSSFDHERANAAAMNVISDLKFRAMYDYQAKEDDEVSFIEGDVILHGDPITDGWMYGTVQRTGQFGMLPSNYVEQFY